MTIELFQSIYVYASLVLVLILSAIVQRKEACSCYIKTPSAFVGLVTACYIGYLNNFNPLSIILISFIATGVIGSALFGKVGKMSGGVAYLIGFLIVFAGFQAFGIRDVINMGFEKVGIFGALMAITIMNLKKQDNTITVYVLGLGILFLTAVFSAILPLVLGSILIVLSEIMLIYNNDYKDEVAESSYNKSIYFSASLYSYGILLIPLAIL